jgi:hypothetical protein
MEAKINKKRNNRFFYKLRHIPTHFHAKYPQKELTSKTNVIWLFSHECGRRGEKWLAAALCFLPAVGRAKNQ